MINYFRQVFCKHEFLFQESFVEGTFKGSGVKVYMRCNKCAYHTNHWKFL